MKTKTNPPRFIKPAPLRCKITVECDMATPVLKTMIARILKHHGAKVRVLDRDWPMADKVYELTGLRVTI